MIKENEHDDGILGRASGWLERDVIRLAFLNYDFIIDHHSNIIFIAPFINTHTRAYRNTHLVHCTASIKTDHSSHAMHIKWIIRNKKEMIQIKRHAFTSMKLKFSGKSQVDQQHQQRQQKLNWINVFILSARAQQLNRLLQILDA